MENVKKKNESDATRIQNVTSRMVGMYRLLTEQFMERYTDIFKEEKKASKKSFTTLKKHIMSEVYEHLATPGKVEEILRDASKEKGSLNEMIFPGYSKFPQQTILIRFGNAVEAAIQNYLGNRYRDIKSQVKPVIHDFLDRNIQLDVAVEKDGTYFISELKYNMNLDTEKTSKVIEKLDLLGITLKKFYKSRGVKTNVTLVSLRYPYAKDIPNLKPEFAAIKEQYILGYVEFFKLFGIDVTQEEWERFHREIGQNIISVYEEAYRNMSGDRK